MNFYGFFAESTGIDLGSVYEIIEHAAQEGSGIAPELLAEARSELRRAQETYKQNPLVAAEVCKTAFNAARLVSAALKGRTPFVEANATRKQREDAGFSSGEQRLEMRRPAWDMWQRAVDRIRVESPALKKSRVCEIVALEYGVTRQAVGKRVSWS